MSAKNSKTGLGLFKQTFKQTLQLPRGPEEAAGDEVVKVDKERS